MKSHHKRRYYESGKNGRVNFSQVVFFLDLSLMGPLTGNRLWLPFSKIQRAFGLFNRYALHHMGVDHSRPHITVPQ